MMKSFYTFLQDSPEWFTTGCPIDKKELVDKDMRIVPKEYDKAGRPIYIFKLGKIDPRIMDLAEDVVPVDDFYLEALMLDDCVAKKGLCVIVDIANFPWRVMKWLTPHNIAMCIKRILTMPIKEYRFHVVNDSFLIHAAIKIIWPFLPQYLKNSVLFHFGNLDGLQEHISKEVLPHEYAGNKEMDFDYQQFIYEKNSLIAKSFKINRKMYLENVKDVKCNKMNKK
ncbi:unnamed protein product [Acanthoscelides obtectus]|uniref:CRAL-TRIO domain-containing protein n=1 Tax=Acanthoscelides obtectus TaxID=200917 RepID=A0A9P0JMG1_ACAOB|nr:unnamed protein product [Acanthoscelides obtectus]CAK1649968.1 Clavesin-2 [Acanthoscelides obtectus]